MCVCVCVYVCVCESAFGRHPTPRLTVHTRDAIKVWRADATIKGFQPPMVLPAGALQAASACPHTAPEAGSFRRWEDPALQWPGRGATGPPPADGTDVVLPSGTTLMVSAASLLSTASKPYGRITVPATSRLVFADPGAGSAGVTLDTLGLVVNGVVEAGSATCRLTGKVTVTRVDASFACRRGHGRNTRAPIRSQPPVRELRPQARRVCARRAKTAVVVVVVVVVVVCVCVGVWCSLARTVAETANTGAPLPRPRPSSTAPR